MCSGSVVNFTEPEHQEIPNTEPEQPNRTEHFCSADPCYSG